MAPVFESIPVIDIAPLMEKGDDPKMGDDKDVAEVVQQLEKACREDGFFYVKGHGIPDSILEGIRSTSREFFELPIEEKRKIKASSMTGFKGYTGVGVNQNEGAIDVHEAVEIYKEVTPGMYGSLGKLVEGCNQWPSNPPNLKSLAEKYASLLKDMCRKIMRGIALALGIPVDSFEGNIAGDPFWLLRLIGYPHAKAAKMQDDIGIGSYPHTDYGLLTIINQDDGVNALQMKNNDGEWISAVPLPGTFACILGDMLKILTNGIYEATLHRVINNSPKYRVCVAFFFETNFEALIEPLDICTQKSGGIKKLKGAIFGQHLVENLQKVIIFEE